MPIGVPKVPYRMPGDDSAQWVDYIIAYTENEFYFMSKLR
jgi:ATP-dependent Clp protease protease subunit